jgi:hypothetical protein
MNLSEFAGRYCERAGPSFWDEPFNAVSNIAFILAALAALRLWRRQGGRDYPALALIATGFSVGIGSFLFHTHTTHWTWLADVIPIAIFIAGYLLLSLYRYLGFSLLVSVLLLAAYEALTVGILKLVPPTFLNRATGYVLSLCALLVIGSLLRFRANMSVNRRQAGSALLLAAVLFAISLFARTIDIQVCAVIPSGTHFLWHIFNALVIYVLLRAAILHGPRKTVQ